MNYLSWNSKTLTDFSEKSISDSYNDGYVFTRVGKGVMHQTRSARINLDKFELSSENRRILKKIADITMAEVTLPYTKYHWSLGKLAQDFYEEKFAPGIMSAQKIKEMLTNEAKSNFNNLLTFSNPEGVIGYTICYLNSTILHYSYPFYDLEKPSKNLGMGMMVKAVQYAKEKGLKYVYLGSLQRAGDVYKLQFKGLEWFNDKEWSNDEKRVREILGQIKS